jgi:hypothetical protein
MQDVLNPDNLSAICPLASRRGVRNLAIGRMWAGARIPNVGEISILVAIRVPEIGAI